MNEKQENADYLHALRHSAEHVLMAAMKKVWGDKIVMAMGPATDDGFYFDFDSPDDFTLSEDDFDRIEAEMEQLVEADLPLVKKEVSVEQAREMFADNPYKQEWLDGIEQEGEQASVYYLGSPSEAESEGRVDLCRGPHVDSTGEIKAFKLLSVAGAYWHGDEENKMLTRIYGTAFPSQKELDQFLEKLEEAKRRDHRRIGKELDLFSFHPEAPGDVFWHDKGYTIFKQMVDYWREIHRREGYREVRTPEILTNQLWEQSGHLENFGHKMYRIKRPDSEEWDMSVKPMNCDGGVLIYKTQQRSYRDFPLRMGELGVVHRYESSGEVHGIMRPREFTQDDAHIYCTPDQIKQELERVMELCFEVYDTFGLELDHLELSTRPENSIGSDRVWERAESIMKEVLEEKDVDFKINEGDGAFYGPKFDFHLKDAIGRTWQCSTIQLDFAQPENFDLEYITAQGKRERPVMIHRVLYGSVERFLGIAIEHYAGNFPVWLAPVQAVVLPITDSEQDYAEKVAEKLNQAGVRYEVDASSNTLSKRIRYWEKQKVPYILVLGGREEEAGTVNVRNRDTGKQTEMKTSEFVDLIDQKITDKELKL
jgi:threonyl-tRNA synthetase